MTDDIVARLRSPEVFLMTSGMVSPVAEEAADEIERLRAVLQHYADENYNGYNANGAYARAAITGEKADG